MTLRFVIVLALHLMLGASAYPWFRYAIPNGDKVPNPCVADDIWKGVGHKVVEGGGERNPFGIAFEENQKVWDEALCKADSDGDGTPNGAELGDPDCTWMKGQAPAESPSGHPGICQPMNSTLCMEKNKWLVCSKTMFDCPGIMDDDIDSIKLQFPKSKVPATETTYICQLFKLPTDGDYHIVADSPIIDNINVTHHMLLYGCPYGADLTEIAKKFDSPAECGMLAQSTCGDVIGGWTVGAFGSCYDDIPAGIKIGKNSYQYAILEVHWNNPEFVANWFDAPGMTLYITDKLRKHDMGVMTVGQMKLRIPPGTPRHEATSTCTAGCIADKLNGSSIYVASVGLHMHLTGTSGSLDIFRDGDDISLAKDVRYRYNYPVDYNHNPPVELMAGDELITKCVYDTTKRDKFVYYGDATSDEMCFAFITYYPKIDLNYCIQFGEKAQLCNQWELESVDACSTKTEEDYGEIIYTLEVMKDYCLIKNQNCSDECMELLKTEPCLKGDARVYLENVFPALDGGDVYLKAIRTCDKRIHEIEKTSVATTLSTYKSITFILSIALGLGSSFLIH